MADVNWKDWKNYLKALAAAVVSAATVIATSLDDDTISNTEWLTAALAVCGSTGVVWYVTNGPGGQYAKAIFAGLTAGFSSLIISLQDEVLTKQETITAVIAVLVGLGLVAAVPGPKPETPPPA